MKEQPAKRQIRTIDNIKEEDQSKGNRKYLLEEQRGR